jgi:NADH-quinone oxidoreductase subunit N
MQQLQRDLALFRPEMALTLGLLVVVLLDAGRAVWRDTATRVAAILTLLVALVLAATAPGVGAGRTIFTGMLAADGLTAFFKLLLVGASLLVVLVFSNRNSKELAGLGQGEFYALLIALTLSNLLLAASTDIVMLYLALEMVSVTSYIMVAYLKGDRMSNEASLKYLLFGAVSTGVMLYGLGLLYGLAGTTGLAGIQQAIGVGLPDQNRLAVLVILLLVLVGFGFKVAAVPFHFWCPDAYQGAPTPVTALLSVAPKAAGFAILTRFFYGAFAVPGSTPLDLVGSLDWPLLLMLVSVLTMTVGNVAALTQTNMKRLLAYSSIGHAGYILMGVVALSATGIRGVLVYLLAYLFMNLGAFLVVTLIHTHEGTFDLRDYPGLSRRAPWLTLAMAVFLLSLVGIPPLVGFMGKLYVFQAVIERGGPIYGAFAVAAALNAAIGAYYYFRVLRTMTIDPGNEDKPPIRIPAVDAVAVGALALANVVPVVLPTFWNAVERWVQGSLIFYAGR